MAINTNGFVYGALPSQKLINKQKLRNYEYNSKQ